MESFYIIHGCFFRFKTSPQQRHLFRRMLQLCLTARLHHFHLCLNSFLKNTKNTNRTMCLCLKELLLTSFLAYVKLGSHLLSQKHSLLIEKWNSRSLKAEQQDLEGGGSIPGERRFRSMWKQNVYTNCNFLHTVLTDRRVQV